MYREVLMSKLWISASIEVIEGKDIQQAKNALEQLVIATRQEPGNIKFNVFQQLDKLERFTLWECWDGELALQKHFSAAHTKSYFAQKLTKLLYIERLKLIGLNNNEVNI